MGGFACPICSEKLDRLPAEAQKGTAHGEINISATPCGHIFHAYCIQKWLSGSMPSNKQCPCCRKDVPRLRCLALFPNTNDDSFLDDSFSQQSSSSGGGSVPVPIPCNHLVEMANLRCEITKLKSGLEEKEQMHNLLTSDYEVLMDRFRREKNESDMWMMKAKQFESYKDIADEYGRRTKVAEGQVKNYVNIENMLKGVEVSVNEEIMNYPLTTDSIRSLLEMKHLLQGELRNTSKRNTEVNRKYEDIRNDKMKLKMQYDRKAKELKELRQLYETSRSTGRIRSNSPVAGPSSAADDNTPTPKGFRMKRRLQEPISSGSSALTDIKSPGLDSDVDLFPSMVKAKKTKPSGLAKFEAGLIKKSRPIINQTANSSTESQQSSAQSTSSAVSGSSQSQKTNPVNHNATINLSSDSSSPELFEFSDDDDFKIRGNVPGAPLPIPTNRMKSLQEKSKTPFLGKGDPKKKMLFRFKK